MELLILMHGDLADGGAHDLGLRLSPLQFFVYKHALFFLFIIEFALSMIIVWILLSMILCPMILVHYLILNYKLK